MAILLQEVYITKRSLEVIIDLFYFSIINVFVGGLISLFLTQALGNSSNYYILVGMILWEIVRVTQYSTTVGMLWNVWSRNLSNMFVSPLSITEYITALFISGFSKALLIFLMVSGVALVIFKFNIFSLGLGNLSLFFLNLTIFSWSVGLVLLGLILCFGTRIQALAWGIIFIFQPLTACFFPLKILPDFVQKISLALPPTYVFEAARAAITDPSINWEYALTSLAENLFYFALAIVVFRFLLIRSKNSGQFAMNES